jgi:hypothetical protein
MVGKELCLYGWDNASFHISKMTREYINGQKKEDCWLTVIHLPKRAPYLNPNERKVNQRIKSDVCVCK